MQIVYGKALITRCDVGSKNPAWTFVDIMEPGRGTASYKIATGEAQVLMAAASSLSPVALRLDVGAQKFGRDLSLTIEKVVEHKTVAAAA